MADLTRDLGRLMRAASAGRERRLLKITRRLDAAGLGRRLSGVRTRLVGCDGRLSSAVARRRHRADAQLRDSVARLETLSPLAVLARGYSVAWNADRTTILRRADQVEVGDAVRLTLAAGELDCEVKNRTT